MGSKAIKMKDISGNTIYPCPYYPVGSIYMSVNNTNPSTFFGGTWVQIKDRFLLACGSTYSNGATGGNATHTHTTGNCTLTIDQIPAHNHKVTLRLAYGSNDPYNGINYGTTVAGSFSDNSWSDNVGGGQAHNHGNTGSSNNMPPYLAVYVWKRTA